MSQPRRGEHGRRRPRPGLLLLLNRSGSSDDSPALGFPIVLVVLAVVAAIVAVVWRLASRRSSGR